MAPVLVALILLCLLVGTVTGLVQWHRKARRTRRLVLAMRAPPPAARSPAPPFVLLGGAPTPLTPPSLDGPLAAFFVAGRPEQGPVCFITGLPTGSCPCPDHPQPPIS